jgi:hypothetical protein
MLKKLGAKVDESHAITEDESFVAAGEETAK